LFLAADFAGASGIVAAAVTAKQPVVVVTINYRLGVLGFLASEEIAGESVSKGATGGANGLLDQVMCALARAGIAARKHFDSVVPPGS